MAESSSSHTVFRCQCGAKLKIPAAAAGRRFKCPRCGFQIEASAALAQSSSSSSPARKATAPTAPRPAQAPSRPVESPGDGDSMLDELFSAEQSAHTTARSAVLDHQKNCPRCKSPTAASAMTCLRCGYNFAAPPQQPVAKPKRGATLGKLAKSGGRFTIGCLLSGAGAIIGAVVWCIVAVITGYELSWIAIGVGAAAGYGMVLGYGKQNGLAGLVSVGMALVGIVLGKIAIVVFVLYAIFSGNSQDPDIQRAFVQQAMIEEKLAERHAYNDRDREEQWDEVADEVEQITAKMGDEEIRGLWQKYRDELATSNREDREWRLAEHRAQRAGDKAGLLPWCDRREELTQEHLQTIKALSDEELDAELAGLDEWENEGRYADAEYVRDYLIYHQANDAMYGPDSPDEEDEAAEEARWKVVYAKATTEVEAVPVAERAAEVRRIEDEAQRQQEEMLANLQRSMDSETGGGSGGWVALFFSAMFDPIDGLFLLLAMATAFKVGMGSSAE